MGPPGRRGSKGEKGKYASQVEFLEDNDTSRVGDICEMCNVAFHLDLLLILVTSYEDSTSYVLMMWLELTKKSNLMS